TISFNMQDYPVNVLNTDSISAFEKHIEEALADKEVKGIIITSGKKDFIVGGDLKLIFSINDPQEIMRIIGKFHAMLRKMETGGKPVVAAINGTALGGGYEVCLACHHRIVVNDSKIQIGLPEVLLGLLPGGGGTQRLPRMIGIQPSLQPLLEGRKQRPQQALDLGMVDALVETQEQLIPTAKKWLTSPPAPLQKERGEPRSTPALTKKEGKRDAVRANAVQPWDQEKFKIPGGDVNNPNNAMVLIATAGLLLKKTYGNYPAPKAILNCVYEGLQLPFDRALVVESRYLAMCALSKEAKNMIRTLFFSMNEANKGAARPADIPKTDIKKIGILGAGMMGAGIAYVSAMVGFEVVLKDVTKEAADKGKQYSADLLAKRLSKKRITQEKIDSVLSKINTTDNPNDIADCQLVIEAVFESRDLKATVTKESESAMTKDAVFASNTSTLPITGLAEASSRPENFIGLHFFSPVDKMPLVEIIVGEKTSDYAIAMAIDYVRRIKKTPIVVNDGRGFFTSRVFRTYLFEGFECLAEGVSPALIENAGKKVGMPVGPLAITDEVSIELLYKINKQTEADTGQKHDGAAIKVVNRFIEDFKRAGKKEGKGFYEYPNGGKKHLWPELSKHFPLADQQPDAGEVGKRLLHIQALEAVKAFEENIITTPQDADVGSILGIGFPPYTGGALSYIDTIGVRQFVEECNALAEKYGRRFEPTEGLKEMADRGESFYNEK
ncbi:enoyl-CoA hydratase/isomerase family protein, partial [bacterium AH-315-M05]|nr:enoyl-CoA hydratase/isomerase family protein [bacterium AH-315-M05]